VRGRDDLAVGGEGEALGRDGGASDVATQVLQAFALVGRSPSGTAEAKIGHAIGRSLTACALRQAGALGISEQRVIAIAVAALSLLVTLPRHATLRAAKSRVAHDGLLVSLLGDTTGSRFSLRVHEFFLPDHHSTPVGFG
jgi:hypothetical protein